MHISFHQCTDDCSVDNGIVSLCNHSDNVNQTVQHTIRDQLCRRGSLLRTLLILGELIMSRYITAKVLDVVDKGLCGRNVLHWLLLILLRICSQSVRPTPYTAVKLSVLFGTKMEQNINVTVSDTV